jgi:hypothetical protein
MEKKNWAKRILALGAGALMLGATLTGALAATWNLADYPAPFVTNGQLDNTVLVVGKAADAADVLGAIDIAAALQASAVSQTTVEVSSTVAPEIDEGIKIEKSGTKFIAGRMISDIQSTSLTDTDLPELLSEEVFDDREGDNRGKTDYDQTILFGTTANSVFELVYDQPGENDVYEDGRPAGYYLKLVEKADVYTYTLLLDSGVDVDNSADLIGNKLYMQGNIYTITEANADTAGTGVDKLTIVAGDTTIWLQQDQPYSVGSHTITVLSVNQDGDMCGLNVDGVTSWVDVDSVETFGDLSIAVLSAVAVHTKDYDQDSCELSIGSNEIVLEDGEEIVVNDEPLKGSTVTFTGTAGDWTGFTINYDAGREDKGINIDTLYLAPGEAWTDPVFGNWKVEFAGVTADYEDLMFDVTGKEDAEFVFTNNNRQKVTVPFHYTGSAYMLGADDDEPVLQAGDTTTEGPDGVYLLYSTSTGDEVHMLQIADLDCDDQEITIDDITYNKDAIAKEVTFLCSGLQQTITLSGLGDIYLNYDNTTFQFETGLGDGNMETEYEGLLVFNSTTVVFTESDGDETTQDPLRMDLNYDTSDGFEISVSGILGGVDNDEDDDSSKWYYTAKGTLAEVEEDGEWVKIHHPEEDVFGNVFVAPLRASVSTGGSEGVMADKVNPFRVGLAVLDADARAMSKNMIIVGGPCANTIAAEVMGNPEDCVEGFEPGKAMIKYFDRNGRAALLVAGYNAQDTVGASYVLADYDSYSLSGDEVEVVVTSLDQITVN